MNIRILDSKCAMGAAAAQKTAELIRESIARKGCANVVFPTGASQLDLYEALVKEEVEWEKVTMFHLDEYVNLPKNHPASFCKYLKERFIDRVSPLKAYYLLDGETDPQAICHTIGAIISQCEIDVALVGIGENGHLAFNDPPADFDTETPYVIVPLDEMCRKQQLGEGWFPTLMSVPTEAISMSIRQIMKAKTIVCTVPDLRKAEAVRNCLEREISNIYPASILRRHEACFYFFDTEAASLLTENAHRLNL